MLSKEDISRLQIDQSKMLADGSKYFELFEKHMPKGLSKDAVVLAYEINNLSCIKKLIGLNEDAKHVIVTNNACRAALKMMLPASIDVQYLDKLDFKECSMKFDCIVMNPPYDGNKNLYGKITLEAKKHSKTVICLSPYLNYLSNSQKKNNKEVAKELQLCCENYEFIDPRIFPDAAFDKELCIFKFCDNPKKIANFDDIYWKKFKNSTLAKSILAKITKYANKSSCYSHIINKSNFDNFCFKVAFSGIRGNRRDGRVSWDWTTLLDEEKMKNFTLKSSAKGDLMGFPFQSSVECQNFVKYVNTDIFEFLIFSQKNSMNTDKWLFKIIPYLPTYVKFWSEIEIAKEFNLTNDELSYIHDEMKDFGWKTKNNKLY